MTDDPERLATTHDIERTKWDAHAERLLDEVGRPAPLPTFAQFVAEWPTWSHATDFVGPLTGRSVVEFGCGIGFLSAILAAAGADVHAFDLSPISVEATRRRLQANGLSGDVIVAAGESLPYADRSFDVAIGTSVLHHIAADRGASELYRVIKPGGIATFLEPMGMNPALNFARDHLPYRQKTARGADEPLTYADLEAWGHGASSFAFEEGQLISMVERFFGWDVHFRRLHALDRRLLTRVPALRRYARQVAIYAVK